MEDIWTRAERYAKERDEANKQLEQVEEIVREMFYEKEDLFEQHEEEQSDLLQKYISKLNKAIRNG